MGTQIHAGDNYRRVVEIVQSGAIGPVQGSAHVWSAASTSATATSRRRRRRCRTACTRTSGWGRAEYQAVPSRLSSRSTGGGGGTSAAARSATWPATTWTCPFWALKLRHPTTSRPRARRSHAAACPQWADRPLRLPAPAAASRCQLTWYDGGKRPPQFAEGKLPKWGDGNLFVGTRACCWPTTASTASAGEASPASSRRSRRSPSRSAITANGARRSAARASRCAAWTTAGR